jgi:3-oxoacyl-[acyl-carrier protein] reductase
MHSGSDGSRVVVITGGVGGIGRGLAELFAADGDSVVVADLDGDAAEQIAKDLRNGGHTALAVAVDVTDEASTLHMAGVVTAEMGRIDVLVNNAGLYGNPVWTGPVLEIPKEAWDQVFSVNLSGVLMCSRAVTPAMRRQNWGRIVNISSMGAYMTGGAYSASKLAVNHLTWSLAAELADYGITVNAVGPGTMDTASMRRQNSDENALNDRINRAFLVKRLGRPADIYAAVKYFASSEAEWCTGQVLMVNGGACVHL